MNSYPKWLHHLEAQFHNSHRAVPPVLPRAGSAHRSQQRDPSMEVLLYPESPAPSLADSDTFYSLQASGLLSATIEDVISEITTEYDEARRERETLFEESPQWQKLTGKMLAYAKATALLESMKCFPGPIIFS